MLFLYDIIYMLFALCYLPFFLIRVKYHRGFLMRLGIFPQSLIERIKGQKVIWLHTVSVGEAEACRSLIKDLRAKYSNFRLLISTVTETGNRIAKKLIEPDDFVIYAPLDISLVVVKVINIINPQLLIIAEAEIWPNLIINLGRRRVPIVLVNGRISDSSFNGYRIIRLFLKKVFQNFSLFCMQTEVDAQRIIALGAGADKVKVTGNMKFDLQQTEDSDRRESRAKARERQNTDLGISGEEQLFIAGSTHRGEEKMVVQVFKELVKNHLNLRLLIAPRHIERVAEIEKLIAGFGFKAQRVSQLSLNYASSGSAVCPVRKSSISNWAWGFQPPNVDHQPILVLDTIGQLKDLYAQADIVFIGGSLIPHGGQNPIEPAVFSKPILFGSHMFNFSKVTKIFLNQKAALMVKDARQLKNACNSILNNPRLKEELGARAKALVQQNKGASFKNMELIKELLVSV